MPSFWWWFLQIHGGPAVGDGNILLWGMFEHSYHFKSQIDLDLDRSIRCIFFWVGASGKTGYIYIYIHQTCGEGPWKTAGEWSHSRSPGYDEKYPDILTSILQLVDMRKPHFFVGRINEHGWKRGRTFCGFIGFLQSGGGWTRWINCKNWSQWHI